MFPEANIQVRVFDGRKGEFVVCAVGHSIFNHLLKNLGALTVSMLILLEIPGAAVLAAVLLVSIPAMGAGAGEAVAG